MTNAKHKQQPIIIALMVFMFSGCAQLDSLPHPTDFLDIKQLNALEANEYGVKTLPTGNKAYLSGNDEYYIVEPAASTEHYFYEKQYSLKGKLLSDTSSFYGITIASKKYNAKTKKWNSYHIENDNIIDIASLTSILTDPAHLNLNWQDIRILRLKVEEKLPHQKYLILLSNTPHPSGGLYGYVLSAITGEILFTSNWNPPTHGFSISVDTPIWPKFVDTQIDCVGGICPTKRGWKLEDWEF